MLYSAQVYSITWYSNALCIFSDLYNYIIMYIELCKSNKTCLHKIILYYTIVLHLGNLTYFYALLLEIQY